MNFLIADTFTSSLARLTRDEQKSVKTTAFDLQVNPASPGMSFHKLDRAKDKNFWSVRVSRDIRLIVHKTADSLLLCYVDHHDKAYAWAERRKLETHPQTGAAQFVEVRESIQEIVVPKYVETETRVPVRTLPALFANRPDSELLSYGIPLEWLDEVRLATDETLLSLTMHLPAEAAEALLELATGGKPRIPEPVAGISPFEHPDAQRRFRLVTNVEELALALDFPWDKWTVFLHPEQRQFVEKDFHGPARVSGSAGTGKTIVALHRAVFLARKNPAAQVLLTTFSNTLARALRTLCQRLLSQEPAIAQRIEISSLGEVARSLYEELVGPVALVDRQVIEKLIGDASQRAPDHKFTQQFLVAEWDQVIDAWQLDNWEAYRDVARLGRKTRLTEARRQVLWSIFADVQAKLDEMQQFTEARLFTTLADELTRAKKPCYNFAVVDEAQDIGIPQLRFLAALGASRPDALFFSGDLGQRIFQQPFSWKSLGVDVRGRSRTLRINYRTSHQIRQQADRLLGPVVSDVDGNSEDRSDTISVFNGPPPTIQVAKSEAEEIAAVGRWLSGQVQAGIQPEEMAIFVRSHGQLSRAEAAARQAGLPFNVLDQSGEIGGETLTISTMHLAKGLEFRVVVVMACDDEVIPLQERIESVTDDGDLEEVYDTERHLLYVACTRARDALLISSTEPASEFLDDLRAET
ncbi:3'-5' exonuclease [Planctopirus hydrillae]|uniref:DNA 3'-5' helicase n=1 Tax=Planctopirus hydrillae TaxID=1841610 RepID=A0A1C3EIT1_9PLAN|nr:3'-5' exonuclease [Planctopirus hydrillae]ODA33119.1 DNA helicase [Planctopirus hydrillae]